MLLSVLSRRCEAPAFFWRHVLSERLIKMQNADLKALYNSAFTSKGAGLMASDVLQSLLLYAQENEAIPTILECYRLKNGLEIPEPEYGVSYPLYQEISQGLTKQAQVSLMISKFSNALNLLKNEPDIFGFEVWFE